MATTPTYVGAGTWQVTTAAASVPFPAGWAEGDLLLIVCESWNDDGALAVPAGWLLAAQASSSIGGGQGTNSRNTIFYRFAQAGDGANVTIAGPGNHLSCGMLAYRGVDSANPFDAINTYDAGYAITVSMPGVTTTIPNTFVLYTKSVGDGYGTNWDTANSQLTTNTKVIDQLHSSGNDGGYSVLHGEMLVAGATGTLSASSGTANECHAGVVLALAPVIALPVITDEPDDVTVSDGQTATFSVTASGDEPITYQWYETTAGLLSGETSSTLAVVTSTADDGNSYYCEVTNPGGTTTSATATLTVTVFAQWAPQSQGPRTLRQLYHWAWDQFKQFGSAVYTSLGQLQTYLEGLIERRTRWMGEWVAGTYEAYDQVEDAGWLMIANKQTTDRAAPQPQGDPFFLYTGTTTTESVTASQVIMGGRYTPQISTQLVVGFRVYTVVGNFYRIFTVEDPQGAAIATEVLSFTANAAGWQNFGLSGGFLDVGQTLDIIVSTSEPDPTPTTFTGDWDYQTPQNPTVPVAGQIQHSRSQPATMNISTTDANAGDRYAELATLTVGDIIDDGILRWAIQSTTDLTTYFNFGVSPATNSAIGTKTFTFETVTATPISYERDVDFWLGNPEVKGLFGADTAYPDIIADDNQYSVDIQLQNFSASPDWDFQAVSGSGGGGASSQLTIGEQIWVAANAGALTFNFAMISGITWQEISRRTINAGEGWRVELTVEGKRTDAFGYFVGRYFGIVQRDGTVTVDDVTLFESSPSPQTGIRWEIDGNDVVFEARTAPAEMWRFETFAYFNELGGLL